MDVSIIIVNYNTKRLTDNCIKSIVEKTKDVDYEIILVANRETLSALALTLGETTLADGKYKGYKVQEDNSLKTDIFVLKVEKKGEK